MRFWLCVSLTMLLAFGVPRVARAEVFQAPIGGAAIPVPSGLVACAGAGGWTVENGGRALAPPHEASAVGRESMVALAPDAGACGSSASRLSLVATGKWPELDATSVSLFVDDARLEVAGRGLAGMGVRWQAGDAVGSDVCLRPEEGPERCSFGVGRGLPADPAKVAFHWAPAGARHDAVTFDASGRRVGEDAFALRIARLVIARLAAPDTSVDLASRPAGKVPLVHPEAVASADCGAADCEAVGGVLTVRDLGSLATSVQIKLRLLPHVFLQHGDSFDPAPTITVSVLPCALGIASGRPFREVDDVRVVVRGDPRCIGGDARFVANGRPAPVLRAGEDNGSAYALVRVGRLDDEELLLTVGRTDAANPAKSTVLGQARIATRDPVLPRASLEIPEHGPTDVIPTNRRALVRFADPPDGDLVLLSVPGEYEAFTTAEGTWIIGEKGGGGFVSLRFGYRDPALPHAFAKEDLAILSEQAQRPLREVDVPVALGASTLSKDPLVELVCGPAGHEQRIVAGSVTHVRYAERDTCRVVFHRERLAIEDGGQSLHLDIDVTRVDGTARPEAHISQSLFLRRGLDPRLVWIHGIAAPFDRVTIRVSHGEDAARDVDTRDDQSTNTSVQWSFIAGTGRARIYATTAVPTGLFRFSDRAHSGILSLSLGVLARLTWLDSEGNDGFLGLEGGTMVEGLPNDVSSSGQSLTQVATVIGVGLSVPIANRSLATETSINLHAWLEYEVSRAVANEPGNPLGFVFGPSISIGNIGTNL